MIDEIKRMRGVTEATGLGKSQVYELMKQGEFPRPITLVGTAKGWLSSEIAEWIESRKAQRDQNIAA